jgi:glutamate dehydrogenase (NAD(P)+)
MMHPGRNNLPAVTGKPLDIGGSHGREEATARGVLFAARRALERGAVRGLKQLTGARVAVQGFGNVGSVAARLFAEAGARLVAVSDSRGGVASDQGLDPVALAAHKRKTGGLAGAPGTRPITNEELLAYDCDVLVPAAMECQIRCDNAVAVRAKLVAEGANAPTTPAADRMLYERGITVLPDILANSGGVCVSYFEWVQNIENEQWDVGGVNSKLRTKMERAFDAVLDRQAALNRQFPHDPVDLRMSALAVAIERVAHVALERGIWP